MSIGDNITASAGQALRSLGSRYPVTYIFAAGLGMLTKMCVHATANSGSIQFLKNLNSFHWIEFALVWLGLLLTPAVLGKSRVPDRVKENLESIKISLEHAQIPESQRKTYYDLLIKGMIRQISSNYKDDISEKSQESAISTDRQET